MWLVAGLWHEVIMAHFYAAETGAKHEGTAIILIAYLILAGFMTYLFSRMGKTSIPLVEGLKFGAVIGLLWVFPHELAMAGAHGEPLTYVFTNAAWHVVEQGVGGVVLSLMLSRK